jgi:hypothetical protein
VPAANALIPERRISVAGIATAYYEMGACQPIVLLYGQRLGGIPAPPAQYINWLGRIDHVIGFPRRKGTEARHAGSFVAARVATLRPDLGSRVVLDSVLMKI